MSIRSPLARQAALFLMGLLQSVFLSLLAPCPAGGADHEVYVSATPGQKLIFPDDEGSHPEFRTEWWYVTGWLDDAQGKSVGFQITFFRVRPRVDESHPSSFAARQIYIAHAAISDPARGRLLRQERISRSAFDLAGAKEGKTEVWLDDWRLVQHGNTYIASVPAGDFRLELRMEAVQPVLLQGDKGYSRKGQHPDSASHYYSIPHLRVSGTLERNGKSAAVKGTAWLDHEWSSGYMDAEAVGWDWVGLNLDDGGALMAFRMRDRRGESRWAGGAYRGPTGETTVFQPEEVSFTPLGKWRSPRTGTVYPVSWRIRAGTIDVTIQPLMDDQENDARGSAGTLYWEGAVRVFQGNGVSLGKGYLEMTGYWRPMRL